MEVAAAAVVERAAVAEGLDESHSRASLITNALRNNFEIINVQSQPDMLAAWYRCAPSWVSFPLMLFILARA